MRASWLRDVITEEQCELQHVSGKHLFSDALTKVLEKVKLAEARDRLQLVIWDRD